MRSRLDDARIRNVVQETSELLDVMSLAITANFTIPANAPPMVSFDATATGRTITLPAVPAENTSASLYIRNGSSSTAVLTIQDPTGPTTVLLLSQGQTGFFFNIGTTWYGGLVATGISAANAALPAAKYTTAALQSTIMTNAQVAGAAVVAFENTGTTPANLQFPLATDIIAAIPNAQVGMAYELMIRNSSGSANTATITTNTGVTLTGTMTIAQNTTRFFLVTVTGATTITVNSMGISAAAV